MTTTSDDMVSRRTGEPGQGVMVAETQLKAGALRLPEVLMQSVTMIAPAIAALFFTPFVVSFAGVASPLAYPVAFVISLMLGIVLVEFAKKMPSAGGYYTYISRSINPYVGWLVAWIFALYAPTVGGIVSLYMGNILQQELKSNWSIDWPWFPMAFMLAVLVLVAALQFRGISLSGRTIVVLGGIEIGLVVLLALWSLVNPGSGGLNLKPYNPGNLPSLSGFALAIVFSIQAFTGWDGAAPLAEETENPERNIPRAVIGSIVILGVFLILVTWAVIIGWGTAIIGTLPSSSELPAIVVAKRVWGGVWWLILWALLSSTVAVSLACANTGTRMWYAMARSGSLPSPLTKLHPVYKTPVNTIFLQLAVNAISGIVLFIWLGAVNGYGYQSLALALAVIIVYTVGNIGVFMLYRREYPGEFNPIIHAFFPVVSTAALIWLLYKQLSPFPPDPLKWAVPTVIAWIVLGGVILAVMRARGQDAWLLKAGEAIHERPETPEELAHRPSF
jgi:amino acid transporter